MFDLSQFIRHSDATEDWLARYLVTEAQRGRRIGTSSRTGPSCVTPTRR